MWIPKDQRCFACSLRVNCSSINLTILKLWYTSVRLYGSRKDMEQVILKIRVCSSVQILLFVGSIVCQKIRDKLSFKCCQFCIDAKIVRADKDRLP